MFYMTLSLSNQDGQSQLVISFPDHQMTLVPGSKNDLFQAMEKTAAVTEQKRLKFKFQEAGNPERRLQ